MRGWMTDVVRPVLLLLLLLLLPLLLLLLSASLKGPMVATTGSLRNLCCQPSYLPPVALNAVMRGGTVDKVVLSNHKGFDVGGLRRWIRRLVRIL